MPSLIRLKSLATMEYDPQSRTDVSTITSRSIDSQGDIVIPEGLNWDRFYENGSPVNYQHSSLRVGHALWIKPKGDKIIAKTAYDRAPKDWNSSKPWVSDLVFEAVCKGILSGKSITLLPEEEREPTEEEAKLGVKNVITKGTVEEFSVCKMPVNPDAIVEEIQKALDNFVDPEALIKASEMDKLAGMIEGVFKSLSGDR